MKNKCKNCKGTNVILKKTGSKRGEYFDVCPVCSIVEAKKVITKQPFYKTDMIGKLKYGQKDLKSWANREYQSGLNRIAESY